MNGIARCGVNVGLWTGVHPGISALKWGQAAEGENHKSSRSYYPGRVIDQRVYNAA
jgi:hypothetical protein